MSNKKRKQLVADQFGIIRPDDQPGNGYREVAKQARAGYLERLCRGHYVAAHVWEGLHREKRLAITALAVVSETSSGVISGAAALALHGSWVLVRDAKIVVVGGSQQFHGIDYCMRLRSEIHLDHTQGLADRRVAVLARAAFDECRVRFRQKGPESVSWRAAVLAVEGRCGMAPRAISWRRSQRIIPACGAKSCFIVRLQSVMVAAKRPVRR